ncbi:MAG: hypothetical protein E7E98_08265 [Cutibacterium avidum]|nr:hypothetical protein [Cutibacterium avidum]
MTDRKKIQAVLDAHPEWAEERDLIETIRVAAARLDIIISHDEAWPIATAIEKNGWRRTDEKTTS